MKPKKIIWKGKFDEMSHAGSEIDGSVNKAVNFTIRQTRKKNPKFLLLTHSLTYENFPLFAYNSKKNGEFDTPELAKEQAQKIVDALVKSLTE